MNEFYPNAKDVEPVIGQQALIFSKGQYHLTKVISFNNGICNSRDVEVESGTIYDAHNVLLVPLPHQKGLMHG